MTARIVVDDGAQYVGAALRLAVRSRGADAEGPYVDLALGDFPARLVRARVGVPIPVEGGGSILVAALSPIGVRPSVALEIAETST